MSHTPQSTYWTLIRDNTNFRKLWLAQMGSNAGDWFNDVPMFRAAGRSFAMGQAPEDVKRAASDVLKETSETGGGIARVVDELFGVR